MRSSSKASTSAKGPETPYEKHKPHLSHEYKILFVLAVCMMLGSYLVVQENVRTYMFDFLAEGFEDPKILNTLTLNNFIILFGVINTGSRLLNIILSFLIKRTCILMAVSFSTMFIGNALIFANYHYSVESIHLFYVGLAFLVNGFSSILPLTIHLVEERITMTTNKICIIYFSNAIFITLKEYLYQIFTIDDRLVFFQQNFLFISISISTFILLLAFMERTRMSRRNLIA